MPNIWTHNIFGELIAGRIGNNDILRDNDMLQLFRLGCQGPDFMFYHHFLPWQGESALNKLGSRMHSEHCGEALLMMADAVNRPGYGVGSPLGVYVFGFMMHHVLDRNVHPYVFSKSGYRKWDHQRFEVIMDTIVVNKHLGLSTWNTPVWRQIDIGPQLPGAIAAMMGEVTERYYSDLLPAIASGDWNDAYRDMIRAQKLFHDPYGVKRLLTFGRIEPLVYKRRNRPLDYFNEARGVWRHPAVPEETSTESFDDLWDKSIADGLHVWRAAEAYWSGEPNGRELLAQALGNVSYEHGKPCEPKLELTHAETVWQHIPS